MAEHHTTIKLNGAEVQSCYDRVAHAEGLVLQLPLHHDGRNTWLLNFGTGPEAVALRKQRGVRWDDETRSAELSS